MGQQTSIEWTHASWNPVTGCTKVSPGCDHCYAAALAGRLLRTHYLAHPAAVQTRENAIDPFAVRLWPERLNEPNRWKRPRRIFVNSMSDLFHRDIPEEFVLRIFEIMIECNRHTYQILTKRPSRVHRFLKRNSQLLDGACLPSHIWIGTSVENQMVAYRVAHLRLIPATVRFLSCEPLLGPLTLDLADLHWVIAGGESGPGHRPMELAWARSIRDQCMDAGVPFFFKQVGGRTPKAGGRVLDGKTWDAYPEALRS
jgi:protein gp37